MHLRHVAIAALLLASPVLDGRGAFVALARADEDVPPPVPGPLRPLPATTETGVPSRRPPTPRRETVAPPRVVRAFVGRLAPLGRGELARGDVRLDVATHQVRIENFSVTDGRALEVALVAADRVDTTAQVLAAKRVSLGPLKRIRAALTLRFPAELDPTVYRTLIVWSRRDRAPRAFARLLPERAR